MPYNCELTAIDPHWALVIKSRVNVEGLAEVFANSFASLVEYLEELGEDIIGPPFAIYHNVEMEELDVEMGLPVAGSLPGKGDIVPREILIQRAASTVHTGPYEDIESAYVALAEWMNDNGHEPEGASYEFYLNDPGSTDPLELQTMIFIPVKGDKEIG